LTTPQGAVNRTVKIFVPTRGL